MFVSLLRKVIISLFALAMLSAVQTEAVHAADKEVVKFRLLKQRTIHLTDTKVANSYHNTLKKLGCKSDLHGHEKHFDLTYRCQKWRKVELDSHSSAHKWQKWLIALGFETKHYH